MNFKDTLHIPRCPVNQSAYRDHDVLHSHLLAQVPGCMEHCFVACLHRDLDLPVVETDGAPLLATSC